MSTNLYSVEIGSIYDFKLLAPAILGSGYSGAKVTAILDFQTASILQDVGAQHAQVLSDLASGTPADPSDLVFLKLTTSSGATSVIAQDWLASAPTKVESTTIVVTIPNTSVARLPQRRAALQANGFTNFSISSS